MTPFQKPIGTIFQINVKLLLASGFALIAWSIWPDSMRGYGWGFLSICLGGAAFGLLIDALRTMVKFHQRRIAAAEFMKRGKSPKSAKLADDETLEQAGML